MSEGPTRTSLTTTGGPSRAPNRAMLRAVGFTDEDFNKPVGLFPCHKQVGQPVGFIA